MYIRKIKYLDEPNEADINKNKHKLKRNRSFIIAFIISIFLIFIFILLLIFRDKIFPADKLSSTLPGSIEINPAVMYNGNVYYWKKMAGPANELPEGKLPQGYEYVGDIEYTDTGKLIKDYQFIATFYATGELFINQDDTNNVCICISTFWLKNAYVIFSMNQ
jgi:hypothetical protein